MGSVEGREPPPKAHVFYFTTPKDVTVDDKVNALEKIVGRYGLEPLMHQGVYRFCSAAVSASSARKSPDKGAVLVNGVSCSVAFMGPHALYATVYPLNPVVRDGDLAAALSHFGKALSVEHPTYSTSSTSILASGT